MFKKYSITRSHLIQSIKQHTRKQIPHPFPIPIPFPIPTPWILCCMYSKTTSFLHDYATPYTPHTRSHTQPTHATTTHPHPMPACLPVNSLRMQLKTILQQQQQSTTTTTTKKPTTTTERTTTTTTTTTTTPRPILFNYDDEGRHKILHQEEVRKQDKYDHA